VTLHLEAGRFPLLNPSLEAIHQRLVLPAADERLTVAQRRDLALDVRSLRGDGRAFGAGLLQRTLRAGDGLGGGGDLLLGTLAGRRVELGFGGAVADGAHVLGRFVAAAIGTDGCGAPRAGLRIQGAEERPGRFALLEVAQRPLGGHMDLLGGGQLRGGRLDSRHGP
jgi:hypothetical protein